MFVDDSAVESDGRPRRSEVIIGTVDVRQLDSRVEWPIMRLLARRYVDHLALGFFVRDLLSTDDWSVVRAVPRPGAQHVYDVFGVRAGTLADSARF